MIKQTGFTLIELMLSLTLGLIITAAAILLFLAGQKSLSMQQGVSDIQDNANFGLNYLTNDIRLANLNNPKAVINDQTAYGGIVLTSSANAATDATGTKLSNIYRQVKGDNVAVGFLSGAKIGPSNVQVAGSDTKSDQLVIQYIPQYIKVGTKWEGGYDCEGNSLSFTDRQVVVQRYFLRKDDKNDPKEPNEPLALACAAGHYPVDPAKPAAATDPLPDMAITGYGNTGEIIMKRVDHLRVLLNIQDDTVTPPAASRRYISVNDYMALTAPRPRIVAVQLGILARSAQSVGAESSIKDDQKFVVLDQTVTVKKPQAGSPKYIRQVVSQTIALRNVIGGRGS
ncbi:PilW family protein [Acinetobacter junii]|uniref:PilW family protein n=1 Tax=Acinetobacter TaxID=469 RepID=UPI001F363F56|nr:MULTISPECIES: PilW family protein [Acinetobacter]MCE6003292.1 PilW family protein [Acinetobacter junii]MCU4394602.1 PilW family protein [Acinetobacter parvus]MCU4611677.1 PilW family protein [Acinetobacter parvus]